jgi:hypothetical protein
MSVVAQLVRFPLIHGNQVTLHCSRQHITHHSKSHKWLKSILTYFFNTRITAFGLCLFFDSPWCYAVTNLSLFLLVLCTSINIKLSLCREYTIPLLCYIFKIVLDHFVPMLGKISQICSSKTYYINHLTHKNCNFDDTSSPTGQLIIILQVVNCICR